MTITAARLASTYDLSPLRANLLSLLYDGDVLSHAALEALGVVSPKVTMHRLRKSLARVGLTVKTRRGSGYYLAPETREKIIDDAETLDRWEEDAKPRNPIMDERLGGSN